MPPDAAAPAPAEALAAGPQFFEAVVRWQKTHGRAGLPWQQTRDPYRVWLSEIMLQQTQVATVRGYFGRFLQAFPDVGVLASAHEDQVLGLWSGLGYYSRARNLHRCAREVMERFGGAFPRTAAELQTLPGIGRSTAAAIAAFCFDERVAILDGNVKRVLSRVLGFGHDLSRSTAERALWDAAGRLLPPAPVAGAMPAYTQGLMDLGATVCLPRKPNCLLCPVERQCAARLEGQPERYPLRTRRLKRSTERLWLLLARDAHGAVWLVKRPAQGIWAGLYCAPVFDSREALQGALPRPPADTGMDLPVRVHALTHKDLHLHPVLLQLRHRHPFDGPGSWFQPEQWSALGLPAPIRALLLAASA